MLSIMNYTQMNEIKTDKFSWLKKHLILTLDPANNDSLWAIAWVSFFSGTASVMVFSILPFFMKDELGLNYKQIGYVEGIAVAIAFLTKIISGLLSDKLKKRKIIILIGAVFSILIKPIFALSTGLISVFIAKSLDRLAKGIRAAPTDALVADLSAITKHGTSFGARYTFYALGFANGAICSWYIMNITHNHYRSVFWFSLIPAILALFILLLFVKEPKKNDTSHIHKTTFTILLKDITKLPHTFWLIILVSFLLMLARFSESFLHYRGRELGFAITIMPFFMMIYNLVEAAASFPVGKLADKMDKRTLLFLGIAILLLANCIVSLNDSVASIVFAIALAGLHMGMTQCLLGALIAQSTPAHLKGSGFAVYYFVAGIATLIGNFMAGHFCEYSTQLGYGVKGAFVWGIIATGVACLALGCWILFSKRKTNVLINDKG